ncbi:hypothetical protein V6N13_040112 [Hibiscus sabdariffa]
MDITFFEQDPYFHHAVIQGETWDDFQPHHASSPTLYSRPSNMLPLLPTPAIFPLYLHILHPCLVSNDSSEMSITTSSIPTPNTILEKEEISNSTSPALDDFPIAIWNGVTQCTKHPIQRFVGYGSLMPSFEAFTANLDEHVPSGIDEALKDPKWRKAVEEEICALEKNATWTVTDLPQGKNGCWLFHKNLCTCGKTQHYSEEEVYMKVQPGLKSVEGSKKVCKLNRLLYGLKQSPRAWFERFTKVILKNGYKKSIADHTLFVKVTSKDKELS